MITEIIVILCFLGSLAGFIFFVKHYFKASKARKNNKKILLAIESAEDSNVCDERFYHNIMFDFLKDVDWGKVIIFTFFLGIFVLLFWNIVPNGKETSTGNEGGSVIIQAQGGGGAPSTISNSINDSSNNTSIIDYVPDFLKDSKGGLSFWFFILIGGLVFWTMSRIIRNHSYL